MKKRRMLSASLLVLLVTVMMATPEPATAEAEFTFKFHVAFGPTSISNYMIGKLFATMVNERSGGRIKIKHYNSKAIVGPFDVFDGVSKGTVEMGSNCGAYYKSKLPEADVEYGFAYDGLQTYMYPEMVYDFQDGAYIKKLREIYAKHGIHYLAPVGFNTYGFMTTFPVNTVKDFAGKKIRTTGDVMVEFMKSVKATPVSMPSVDIYTALQRGTIDGVTLNFTLMKSYKWAEVVKYVILPETTTGGALNMLMNLESYNSLPDDLKKLVDDTAREVADKHYTYGLAGLGRETLTWAQETQGVTIITLTDAEVTKIEGIVRPLYSKLMKTPGCQELYDIRKAFLEKKGVWAK